jgi:selenocysteine lyase/cysteine desulfurase
LNHASLAGVAATIDYLASFGAGSDLRSQLVNAMNTIRNQEYGLYKLMYDGLAAIPGLTIIGPPPDPNWHTPTISFTLDGISPIKVCEFLASKSICAWDGHFYAQRAIEVLGLLDQGGVTRLGINMYNSDEEVDYTIQCLSQALENSK